ncbi:MAG: Fatty acid hydroxylase superfamily protein [Alphaproteobacteria bacterium ADurb.BinA280]|jgi:sterol desaturase/sphingolipid hydroxylase (fatty acid hydroxylase superfamily)|nr:sterol desaturase family protein [Xanthomonadales bacterium]MCC6504175.1 sterol desaturase family protein [Aquimonas sp.]OPZ10371.1 MAG: Fatty acid hydroxylase superfamily protein [Alphaproteobacteria bacterium ADurb.BinA280]
MAWIQRYLVLILVFVSLAMYLLALRLGLQTELAVTAVSVFTLASAWWLERRQPYRKEWRQDRGDLQTDVASAVVIVGVVDPLLKVLAPLAVVALYSSLNVQPVLAGVALWLQIVVVLLLVELGKYWSHRLHHQLEPLWWLHAMHHSSERLYFLNGLRFHPINYVLNFTVAVLPVMLLGVSPEAIVGYLAISQPVVLLQHANIGLQHGWLNWVFSTPEAHRWHHATEPAEANSNFGNALLVWDHVFGTFKAAEGFIETKEIGLFASSKAIYPRRGGYLTQLVSMFKPPCCRSA